MACVEFEDNSVQVKEAIERAGVTWLHEACGDIEAQTKQNAKVKTGQTKGSYRYAVDASSLTGYVGSDYQNAVWEEYGTGEYALGGNGRKGGWFYVDQEGHGHFTRGKKPRRPLFLAFTSLKSSLIRHAEEVFGRLSL